MFEEPIVGSEGAEEGTAGAILEGRGKIPERGLRGLEPGGKEEGRVELVSTLVSVCECKTSLIVGRGGLATGTSEERGTSVVCTTP